MTLKPKENIMASLRFPIAIKYLVIFVYLVLIILSPSIELMPSYISAHDGQRLIALLLLVLISIHNISDRLSPCNLIQVSKSVRNLFILLLALALISAFFKAQLPRHAIIEISIFSSLCYLALFTGGLFVQHKEVFIKQIVFVFWVSILLYMFGFYVGYISAYVSKTPLQWPQPFLGFSNIRLFNQYQFWTIGLITLPILAYDFSRKTNLWLTLALSCWWVILFYSASRGVFIAWAAAIVVTGFVFKKIAWSFLRLQIINIATGFCGYYVLFKLVPSLQQFNIVTGEILRSTTNDRTELWNICLKMIEFNPILGIGPLHYYWYTRLGTHPHNSVLQLAAEWGIPATLIILTLASYGIYCWLKKFNASSLKNATSLDTNLSIILFFTIVSNAAYSLVDGVIVMPISQVLMFTIIGLMIGQSLCKKTKADFKEAMNHRLRSKFAGIVVIALIWSTLPEIIQGLSGNQRGFSPGNNIVNPRIWMQYV